MAYSTTPPTIPGSPSVSVEASNHAKTRRERGAPTKSRLIKSAISLASKRGYSNVPLRLIVEQAECHNISAVHYHFKGGYGLLKGILSAIDSHWRSDIPEFSRSEGAYGVVRAFVHSLDELQQADLGGRDVLTFIYRLMTEVDQKYHDLVSAFLKPRLDHLLQAVRPYSPNIPDDVLHSRLWGATSLLFLYYGSIDQFISDPIRDASSEGLAHEIRQDAVVMATALITAPYNAPEAPWDDHLVDLNGHKTGIHGVTHERVL